MESKENVLLSAAMSGNHSMTEAPSLFVPTSLESPAINCNASFTPTIPQYNTVGIASHQSDNSSEKSSLSTCISSHTTDSSYELPHLECSASELSTNVHNLHNGDYPNQSSAYNSLLQSSTEVVSELQMLRSFDLLPPTATYLIPVDSQATGSLAPITSTSQNIPQPQAQNVISSPADAVSTSPTSLAPTGINFNPLFSNYEADPENVLQLAPASSELPDGSSATIISSIDAAIAETSSVLDGSKNIKASSEDVLPPCILLEKSNSSSSISISAPLKNPSFQNISTNDAASGRIGGTEVSNPARPISIMSSLSQHQKTTQKCSIRQAKDFSTNHIPCLVEVSTSMEQQHMTFGRPTLCYTRILLGEIMALLATMRRATPRWSQHQTDVSQDPLVCKLRELQVHISSLSTQHDPPPPPPAVFLEPFLAVIRSDDTTGPVTKTALASVNRMLSYGLLSSESPGVAAAVEDIATTVTHARFVGTDQGADEVVLWEILAVLKTLLLGPVGHLLTNESVCELLNSSFRICFETRLSELLRNCTEDALCQMVSLLFARLPQFADDPNSSNARRIRMKAGGAAEASKNNKKAKTSKLLPRNMSNSGCPTNDHQASDEEINSVPQGSAPTSPNGEVNAIVTTSLTTVSSDSLSIEDKDCTSTVAGEGSPDSSSIDSGINDQTNQDTGSVDISNTHLHQQGSLDDLQSPTSDTSPFLASLNTDDAVSLSSGEEISNTDYSNVQNLSNSTHHKSDVRVNTHGVKFTPADSSEGDLVPYGMACVREVLRFLVTLTNPTNDQNTPNMITTALGLITVALEIGGEQINKCSSLLKLVRDQLCRNLLLLLKPEVRPTILMASLRVCVLIFESLRTHVKFQLEMFMRKLTDIITSEAPNVSYTHKELALETVVQLWRIPGLIVELFVNFDCDLYSDNIFEDLTKVLSKNAFPVQGLYSTNILSLDALLAVVETLDSHSLSQIKDRDDVKLQSTLKNRNAATKIISNIVSPPPSGYLLGVGLLNGFCPVTPKLKAFTVLRDDEELLREHLLALKEKKRLLATGTDQFNVKPEKGIQFLQDNGILGTTTEDIAIFMKENPKLDKKMIGEYLSKKKNVGILSAFVKSFAFTGLRIDQCLRTFLETFRLPGEAPLIAIIIEYFSAHWHTSNNEPFGKEDAAFTLAYAVIMLNVDQHNQNAKKQNIPMTLEQFRNNLRGVNDGKDFDPQMLEEIYNAICSEEIIMPAEQTGLVKENYLWKMLLKRGATKEGIYMLANDDHSFDRDLFGICWGPTVASLSYVFDKSVDDAFIQKSLSGFKKCASISARYGMSDVFDNLVVSLCKFTGLTSSASPADAIAVEFGGNPKAQLAAKTLFRLVTLHGDILRDGWKNVVEVLLQLFRCRLLPADLTESPDLLEGCVSLYRPANNSQPRVEPSLLSSLYSYIALGDGGSRGSSPEDEECRKRAKKCIVDCHIEKLIRESAFLRHDSLSDMLKAIMMLGDGSCLVAGTRSGVHSGVADGFGGEGETLDEYGHALLLEVVVQIIIANKDRAGAVWTRVHDYILSLMKTCATGYNKQPDPGPDAARAKQQAAPSGEGVWLLCRCVAALLRLAAVLVRRPEMSSVALQSLKMLFLLNPSALVASSLQIVAGVHEVLTLTADHITRGEDWAVIFALMEWAGAGARPPAHMVLHRLHNLNMRSLPESEVGSSSGPDSGHCSEVGSGVEGGKKPLTDASGSRATSPEVTGTSPGGWIMVGREDNDVPSGPGASTTAGVTNEWDIALHRDFLAGLPVTDAAVRSVDTLVFLVRERHMTRSSLPHAVNCARTFVEATLHGGRAEIQQQQQQQQRHRGDVGKSPRRRLGGRKRGDDHKSSGSGGSGGKKASTGGAVRSRGATGASNAYDADESDSDDLPATYQQLSEKLLDLLDTLHTSAGSVMVKPLDNESALAVTDDYDENSNASSGTETTGTNPQIADGFLPPPLPLPELDSSVVTRTNKVHLSGQTRMLTGAEPGHGKDSGTAPIDFSSSSVLWQEVLCPLLQGIARYCCDSRSRIRHMAMTYLQRALLNHDLQTLDAHQWEACFNKVLFPLLAALLPASQSSTASTAEAAAGTEESRLRAATLVQKVYLRHLTTLLTLPTFTALWLTILDFLDKYLHINTTDHLCDAVPEILKNMLLVMETTHVFHTAQGFTRLWSVTWDRVDSFLPGFRTELFKSHPPSKIHRIDVPEEASTSEEASLSQASSTCEGTNTDVPCADASVDARLHRLSLSEESLTSFTSQIILHPPLPASTHTFSHASTQHMQYNTAPFTIPRFFERSAEVGDRIDTASVTGVPDRCYAPQQSNEQNDVIVTPPSGPSSAQPLTASHLFRPKLDGEGEDPFQGLSLPISGI
ncbi:Golgi-specific brefeldin A-resistance guanine nucleotide exchange factor 1-like isoform X2 [Hyalella azteca]|uniref:Golgi-specific brefeldin A-resistance guanine nucleotide exchange factor 1-like isoform X2 n=1 Tax=Hyalella azteca TaxID=294128 RepID=A0A8B7N528_HYAAZ|nr:Golgi-specific brefeldin A-resistance guanine nucleotide exchange factor 1-like isoform X2 [Hyalella azteca]